MGINLAAALDEPVEATETRPALRDVLDLEAAKVRFGPYLKEIDRMAREAEALKVEDEKANQGAVALGTSAKKLAKQIEDQRKVLVAEPNDFVKSVNSFAKMFTDRLGAIEDTMKRKVGQYRAVQEQKRREAEAAAKKAAEDLQKKLDADAKKAGTEPVKVDLPVVPKAQPVTRAETGAAYGRKAWAFELVSLEDVPREWLRLDEVKVRDAIRAGIRNIPGLRIYEEERTSFRTA